MTARRLTAVSFLRARRKIPESPLPKVNEANPFLSLRLGRGDFSGKIGLQNVGLLFL